MAYSRMSFTFTFYVVKGVGVLYIDENSILKKSSVKILDLRESGKDLMVLRREMC